MMKNTDDIRRFINDFEELNIIGPMEIQARPNFDLPTIYVDGGLKHNQCSHEHWISIGDQDSSSLGMTIKLPQDKDRSDLFHALELLKGNKKLHLHGFLGGRLDHEIINLYEILEKITLEDEFYAVVYGLKNKLISRSDCLIKFKHKGLFSLIGLRPNTVSISGDVQYPLENKKLEAPNSLTLSNQADGLVEVRSTMPIFVYLEEV